MRRASLGSKPSFEKDSKPRADGTALVLCSKVTPTPGGGGGRGGPKGEGRKVLFEEPPAQKQESREVEKKRGGTLT